MTHDGKPRLIHQTQALSHSGLLLGNAARRVQAEAASTGHVQPRAGQKRRAVLCRVTCYFYLMLTFLGQIRSRSHTAGFLNSDRALLPWPLPSVPAALPFSFFPQTVAGCALCERELMTAPHSLQSLPGVPCPGETATKECHHRQRKTPEKNAVPVLYPHPRLPVMTRQPEISV